jgi:hypothetical protein
MRQQADIAVRLGPDSGIRFGTAQRSEIASDSTRLRMIDFSITTSRIGDLTYLDLEQ